MPSLPILDDIPITVMAIVDLRALVNHRNNEIVRVRSTENDFRFDSSSPALDDGISVVKPINVNMLAPGRWLVIVYPVDIVVTGWTIVFTREAAGGSAADLGDVDTGIVYDPAYEYFCMARNKNGPTPTAAASVVTCPLAGGKVYAEYRPDGITTISGNGDICYIVPTNQDLSGFARDLPLSAETPACEFLLRNTGHFYTNWGGGMSDGHWVLARRRRYG